MWFRNALFPQRIMEIDGSQAQFTVNGPINRNRGGPLVVATKTAFLPKKRLQRCRRNEFGTVAEIEMR